MRTVGSGAIIMPWESWVSKLTKFVIAGVCALNAVELMRSWVNEVMLLTHTSLIGRTMFLLSEWTRVNFKAFAVNRGFYEPEDHYEANNGVRGDHSFGLP